ncbi:hypothetical protein Cgig2_030796 [Carnegiea gigantea]|uniref:Protein FAR1-RELATED SEQUENCE n=1 Tax=Carnegiea gigantea TaxID=171969 RepID=A0A9Q1KSB3_9CARY|nr:hypothetical protein Cgig2_030796 [Carnegiea gigantea]
MMSMMNPSLGKPLTLKKKKLMFYKNSAEWRAFAIRKDREWHVTRFVKEHNHTLLSPDKTFVAAMMKPPKTIIIDQDSRMSEAVATLPQNIAYDDNHRQVREYKCIHQEHKRTHNKILGTIRPTFLKLKSPLEVQAFQALTPFTFKKFQEEFEGVNQYLLDHIEGDQFTARYYEVDTRKRKCSDASEDSEKPELVVAERVLEQEPLLIDDNMRDEMIPCAHQN